MKDIKLWFAYDEKEEVIKIENAIKGKLYHCPCCGAEVYPKALKSKSVTKHFCHANGKSCSKNGGESYIHIWMKNVLFTVGQSFKIKTKDGLKEYIVKDVDIEKRYQTKFGEYIPDITITTTDNDRIFVEIYHTNRKNVEQYWQRWFELRSMVIEVSIDEIVKGLDMENLKTIYEVGDEFQYIQNDNLDRRVNKHERKLIEKIYNDVYNYIKGDTTISNILIHNRNDLRKYICSSVVNNIFNDINNYEFLKWAIEKYDLQQEYTYIAENFKFMANNGKPYEIYVVCKLCGKHFTVKPKYKSLYNYDGFTAVTKYEKHQVCDECRKVAMDKVNKHNSLEQKVSEKNKLLVNIMDEIDDYFRVKTDKYWGDRYIWNNISECEEPVSYSEDINRDIAERRAIKLGIRMEYYLSKTDTNKTIDDFYLDTKDREIRKIMDIYKKTFGDNNREKKLEFVKNFYNKSEYYMLDTSLLYYAIHDLVDEYNIALNDVRKAKEEADSYWKSVTNIE